jgi:hypothetical protein
LDAAKYPPAFPGNPPRRNFRRREEEYYAGGKTLWGFAAGVRAKAGGPRTSPAIPPAADISLPVARDRFA